MSPTTASMMDSARAQVAELERDQARLMALLGDADDRMRSARAGSDQELRNAAQEWTGLREVAADIARELDATRQALRELEAAAERERDEAAQAAALAEVDQCETAIIAAYRSALDAALIALRAVPDLRARRAQAHGNAATLQRRLGLGPLRELKEPRPEAALRTRDDHLSEDEAAYELLARLVNHPALTRSRDEVIAERTERLERGRRQQRIAAWDARAAMLDDLEARTTPSTAEERVALRAWLEANPREAMS